MVSRAIVVAMCLTMGHVGISVNDLGGSLVSAGSIVCVDDKGNFKTDEK